jgi:hypothetical protein
MTVYKTIHKKVAKLQYCAFVPPLKNYLEAYSVPQPPYEKEEKYNLWTMRNV